MVRAETGLNQWRSTKEAISWFEGLQDKNRLLFLKYDIDSFYPSITEELLIKSMAYLKTFSFITEYEEELILHCRRSLLVSNDNSVWQKKQGEFDTTMGSLDGAEIAEAVGLYLLSKVTNTLPAHLVGLYRDDGLSVIKGSRSEVERAKKAIISIFKGEGLSITCEGGSKVVDYLDVAFNLADGSYCPYVKPNTKTKYVSTYSNHPRTILSRIQDNVCQRLSRNSSSQEMFERHTQHFEHALVAAGHPGKMKYMENPISNGPKHRARKTIWFNPVFSQNIRTNIAGKFISLVRKCFPKTSPLYPLFNTFNLKVSYSTGPNMKELISKHNAKVLRRFQSSSKEPNRGCNCHGGPVNCPLQGECLTESLVYRADVTIGQTTKHYVGQTMNSFKQRFTGHKSDVRCGRARTGICKFLIELDKKNIIPDSVTWSKVVGSHPRRRGSKICHLCIDEKVNIARTQDDNSLNSRSEMMTRCRHRDALMLSNCRRSRRKNHAASDAREVAVIQEEPSEVAAEVDDSTEAQPQAVVAEVEHSHQEQSQVADDDRPGRRRARVDYKKFF